MTTTTDITVIIGFKDWGIDRLEFAIRSHLECSIASHVEVIISDYGSEDASAVLEISKKLGVRLVRTETNGVWSRARSLNRGVLAATSPYVVTTDADIIFAPRTLELVVNELDRDPNSLCLVQCRDLGPEHIEVINKGFDWDLYKVTSKLRPRWGMGGLAAFSVDSFSRVRGFDERMEIYGGEDNDFGKRMKAHGSPLHWIENDDAKIYHVWHEPSRKPRNVDEAVYNATMVNRDILLNDASIVRNLASIGGRSRPTNPYISVCIATRNRSAMLKDCIESVLAQSFEDFEIVVIDDGSEDDTESVVRNMTDDRIRYFKKEHSGVSASRNLATRMARGHFIAVHDDDDLMLKDRLENHLTALRAGDHGTHGGWVDFDTESGEFSHQSGKPFSYEALLFNGKLLIHGSIIIVTEFFRRFPYDEKRSSGVDFDVLTRMAAAGLKLRHMHAYANFRRLHSSNLTFVDTDAQKQSANAITRIVRSRLTATHESVMREISGKSKPIEIPQVDIGPYRKLLGPAFFQGIPVVGPVSVTELGELTPYLDQGFRAAFNIECNSNFLNEVILMYDKCIDFDQVDSLDLASNDSLSFLSQKQVEAISPKSQPSIKTPSGFIRFSIGPFDDLNTAATSAAHLREKNITTRYLKLAEDRVTLITGTFPEKGLNKYSSQLQTLTSGKAEILERD